MAPIKQLIGITRRIAGWVIRRIGGTNRSDSERLNGSLAKLGDRVDQLSERLAQLHVSVDTLTGQVQSLDHSRDATARRITELTGYAAIESVTRWIRHARLSSRPLISVILPTYDRPPQLERAISSTLQQRYENWELLVIGDGDSGGARQVCESVGDPRVRFAEIPKSGASAARNAGLKLAAGELVSYLDDDNIMDRDWLYAVAWAFEQRPDVDVLYGAFVVDDVSRLAGSAAGALPTTFLHRFSRDALSRNNLADMGTIAHRAGLAGAWFDEGLREMGDWDLLVRLTAASEPLVLPVISHYYNTDAPHRLAHGPTYASDRAVILARAAGSEQ